MLWYIPQTLSVCMLTSGQKILIKGHITPRTCHPRSGQVHPDPLPPADKSAAPCSCGICCLQSNTFHWGGITPKLPLPLGSSGPPPSTRFLEPTIPPKPINQTASWLAQLFFKGSRLCPTNRDTHRPCYICSTRQHLCTPCTWCRPKNNWHFYILNNSVKNEPILIILVHTILKIYETKD